MLERNGFTYTNFDLRNPLYEQMSALSICIESNSVNCIDYLVSKGNLISADDLIVCAALGNVELMKHLESIVKQR